MIIFIAVLVIVYIAQGVYWGSATQRVIENKGYYENWFWRGFFFGVAAMAKALAKPELGGSTYYEDTLLEKRNTRDLLENGGWECSFCHSLNESIISTCACGKSREESMEHIKAQNVSAGEQDIISLLKEYKELMDKGVITNEEFSIKKSRLLKRGI